MERVTHAVRRQRWTAIIKECNESGMKKKEWLQEHNINPKSFYKWQKQLRMELGTEMILARCSKKNEAVCSLPEFGLVSLPEQTSAVKNDSAVIRKGNMEIKVTEEISDAFLFRIIKAVSNA